MRRTRSSVLLIALVFVFVPRLPAQGIGIRVEAIRLLDRANVLSSTRQIGVRYEHDVTFRAFGVDGSEKDGQFTGIFSHGIVRFETVFGDYHAILIHYPDKTVQGSPYQPEPPEALEMDRLTPLWTGWFDHSDTIESIDEATLSGRPAKCIQFQTVNGRSSDANQICIDAERGTLLRWNVGNSLVNDSDYTQFQGVWLPSHIEHYINGQLRMVIDQTFQVLQHPIDWARRTPRNTVTLHPCYQYKPAYVESAPQPTSAGAGPWYDITVHAAIGEDGHVDHPAVLPEGKPELEKRAVQIVSAWTFSPAVCNGKTIAVNATLIVHFPPQ